MRKPLHVPSKLSTKNFQRSSQSKRQLKRESYFDHHRYIIKGDAEKAFEEADHVFTGVVRMGGQEHFYLETQACVVVPKPEDGEMEVFSSTQNPSET
jgi:xanthine dehydrogenase/oxidase